MDLYVQPGSGITPILTAIQKARTRIDLVIFRCDLKEFQKALEAAVQRGVAVHALIAHTNRGGEKRLRKLEQALLAAGVTVSRTGDDLVRYHGKLMIIDRRTIFVLGFNYTFLDIFKSRSFGLVIRTKRLVQEAVRVFEADTLRQPFAPAATDLVISPETARSRLTALIKGARKELLIYDPKIADAPTIRLLRERAKAGVDVRILGKLTAGKDMLRVEKLPKQRLHVRAILRDGRMLFIGSQSLRPLELDRRREIGVIVRDPKVIKEFRSVFESDWQLTETAQQEAKAAKAEEKSAKNGEKDKQKDKKEPEKHGKEEVDHEPEMASK